MVYALIIKTKNTVKSSVNDRFVFICNIYVLLFMHTKSFLLIV